MKRMGTELKNKMSRQERREARLRQEKLRLQKKSKLTLIVYAVIRLIVVGVLVRSAFNGQIESVYTCLLTLVLLLLPSILERKLGVRLPAVWRSRLSSSSLQRRSSVRSPAFM